MAKRPSKAAKTDGRKQRSVDSRERIVRAMLELVREGSISPAADAVAARAGVGLRSVFRHFDNMESLYRELSAEMVAEVRPLWDQPLVGRQWPDLLDEVIGRRSELFERIMPFKVAAEAHRHQSPFLAAHIAGLNEQLRSALERVMPAALRKDTALFESLDLVLSFETWRRLRMDQNLSISRARQTLKRLIESLLSSSKSK